MTDISTAVNYLLAVIDLREVRAIRDAVRANLYGRGGIPGPLGTVHMPHHPIEPEPELRFVDARPALPMTICVPVPVVHTKTVIEPAPAVPKVDTCQPVPEEPHRHRENGPLAPPWKMPLPVATCNDHPVIKCPPKPPDVINKGSLLDFFM